MAYRSPCVWSLAILSTVDVPVFDCLLLRLVAKLFLMRVMALLSHMRILAMSAAIEKVWKTLTLKGWCLSFEVGFDVGAEGTMIESS